MNGKNWRGEYCEQYRRANGREATIERTGSWYRIREQDGSLSSPVRKRDIEQMTKRLRARADREG